MHECPLIPMGAITGKPSKAILTETLEAYRAQGITQFLIYPRSGCELEYLSDDWFGVCEHIITEATRLGFTSLWLYDEYNWPSGTCNKQIPQLHPEIRRAAAVRLSGKWRHQDRRPQKPAHD